MTAAEAAIAQGDTARALTELQGEVRAKPGDARLRIFMFQLLCVLGQWDRALTQLELCAELDAGALPMRDTYRPAIECELIRRDVFAGKRSPLLFGEPDLWIAQLIESLILAGQGEDEAARRLREDAFSAAPATPGVLNDRPFLWLADGDMRMGPVLECILNGRYSWVPFTRLQQVTFEPFEDLRDAVWAPAMLCFTNGGEAAVLVPARYPGAEKSADGALALGRKTEWDEQSSGVYFGLGQRVFATDDFEVGISEVRTITFDAVDAGDA